MNLFKYIVIAALVIILLMVFRVGFLPPGEVAPELLPAVSARDYTGNEVTLGALSGKVTLLAFWFPT